jgi:hypothetical protein
MRYLGKGQDKLPSPHSCLLIGPFMIGFMNHHGANKYYILTFQVEGRPADFPV